MEGALLFVTKVTKHFAVAESLKATGFQPFDIFKVQIDFPCIINLTLLLSIPWLLFFLQTVCLLFLGTVPPG